MTELAAIFAAAQSAAVAETARAEAFLRSADSRVGGEGIRVLKAAEGIEGYDVNRMATRQEMRSFVCGQCHVEYYFKGPEKRLACQTCHRLPEEDLRARVERIQQTTQEIRNRATDAVVALIGDLAAARQGGATAEAIERAQSFHRRAQFLLDFIEAENSTGFHSPQEAARILAQSIDLARQGQLVLRAAPSQPLPQP